MTDLQDIIDILRRSNTIRLGLHGEPYPYVVPLSFGFEETGEGVALYFHGAKEGLKHELIAKNPHACVEADVFHRYAETAGGITTEYESVIGFGIAARVEGEEAARGLDLLQAHCGYENYGYVRADMEMTWVYKITLTSVTGKRNTSLQ